MNIKAVFPLSLDLIEVGWPLVGGWERHPKSSPLGKGSWSLNLRAGQEPGLTWLRDFVQRNDARETKTSQEG